MHEHDEIVLRERVLASLPQRLARLRDALSAVDCAALRLAAHELHGTAATFGLTGVAAAAARLESLVAGGAPAAELRQALARVEAAAVTATPTTPMSAPALAAGQGERLLVVDDDGAQRALLMLRLRRAGYAPVAAANADEALGLLSAPGVFRLAVLDLQMPGRDGAELLTALRQLPQGRVLPVLMLTADGSAAAVARCRAAGADELLLKPVTEQALVQTVARLLAAAPAVAPPPASLRTDTADCVVLIVDDSPENRELLAGIIRRHTPLAVRTADSAAAALAALDPVPDLIILDILMPGTDGLALARLLKADLRTREVPLIFLTSLAGHEDKQAAFNAGGIDYITKPYEPQEVVSRVTAHVALRRVARERQQEAARLQQELELAAAIQRRLLELPPLPPQVQVAVEYLPLAQVSGDYCEVVPLPDQRLLLFLADVTGHGVPAALYAMTLKTLLQREARHGGLTAGTVLTALNRDLAEFLLAGFCPSAVAVVLNPRTGAFTYASAGHPEPLVQRADGSVAALPVGNTFLGFDPLLQYDEGTGMLEAGDRLVLYSDGLLELRSVAGTHAPMSFVQDRLTEVAPGLPSAAVARALLQAARDYAGTDAFRDDVAVLVAACAPTVRSP